MQLTKSLMADLKSVTSYCVKSNYAGKFDLTEWIY